MPDLQIEKNSTFNPIWVLATMLHPNDERCREEYSAAQFTTIALEANDDDEIEFPPSVLRTLLHAPSYDEILNRSVSNVPMAAIAGDILTYLAMMTITGYKEPSIKKAKFMAQAYFSTAKTGLGEKVGSSTKTINDSWEKYKSVAHLWGAFRISLPVLNANEEFPKITETLFGERFDEFLAVSEGFRQFGENVGPSRNKLFDSFLPKGKTWRVPESYGLPIISFRPVEMPEWMKKVLKEYKSPKTN